MKNYVSVCMSLLCLTLTASAAPADPLADGFKTPPPAARAHTMWMWMNGHITKEGITADLEAMTRVGIGGVKIFNISTPNSFPDGPVSYLSPQWLELFQHAVSEATRLKMELGFHNCAGWSSSGGPWVKPEQAMQTVVIGEATAKGDARFDAVLPRGKMQKEALRSLVAVDFYRDIAVLAFPTPIDQTRTVGVDDKASNGSRMRPSEGVKKYDIQPQPVNIPAGAIIPQNRVVDLTKQMAADGRLTWDAPAGNWTILRIGHTCTGQENSAAPQSGTGLECNKLSREALDAFWAGGVQPVLNQLGPLAGKAFNNVHIDSYEKGRNNWTSRMREEFQKRRGYDPIPFLPTLTGRIIGSSAITERFLWDWRRTIADLFADNYYGHFADLCHQRGLTTSIEPYGGVGTPFESLQVAAKAGLPMGEFWVRPGWVGGSVKIAANAAHTHGRNIVGAEAFTATSENGRWLAHPGALKGYGDVAWTSGINRMILHCYAHQPWPDTIVPGMTMGPFGTHFGRNNTWWEQSKPWFTYIARGQQLLQSGKPTADVLAFGGEAAPTLSPHFDDLKAKGYDYDACGTDLIGKLTVRDGQVVTPAGTAYKLLVLPETPWMTPTVAGYVRDLVKAGAAVLGHKTTQSPSLAGFPACDDEVKKIADAVWNSSNSRVFSGLPVEAVMAKLGVGPDCLEVTGGKAPPFIHRSIADAEVWFVANPETTVYASTVSFRIAGRVPELWDAETGRITDAPRWRATKDRTEVTLELTPSSSVFVVFRRPTRVTGSVVQTMTAPATKLPVTAQMVMAAQQPVLRAWEGGSYQIVAADGAARAVTVPALPAAVPVEGPWQVAFQAKRGAPASATLPQLASLSTHADPGIRHFSGQATYHHTIIIPAELLAADRELYLDLGEVAVIAEVTLNGKDLGTLWRAPFRVDITAAAKPGTNELVVRVTDLWVNRLIGDAVPDPKKKDDKKLTGKKPKDGGKATSPWPEWLATGLMPADYAKTTFVAWSHWKADDKLVPAGLIGPVVLRPAAVVPLTLQAADSPAQTHAPAAEPSATRQVIPAQTDKKDVPPEVMQRINEETKTPFKYGVVIRGEKDQRVDCPSIFRQNGQWYMVYVAATSHIGYETLLARSADLLHWEKLGKIMSFRAEGWDKAQVAGGISLCDPTWGGGSEPQAFDGKYWMSYFGGPNPGRETPPLAIGMAWTKTPTEAREWNRLAENPVLSGQQTDARWFEKRKLYKSQIIWDKEKTLGHPFVMYFNAQGSGGERIGMAVSDDMTHWKRYGEDPVVANGTRERSGISGDPQIVKIGDVWVMFYFGYGWKEGFRKGIDTFACSYDMMHWTQWQGEPQIKPSEKWDSVRGTKPWVIKHDGIVYHFYGALGEDQNRTIALATSKDLKKETK